MPVAASVTGTTVLPVVQDPTGSPVTEQASVDTVNTYVAANITAADVGALSSVTHDASLAGAGTALSPLSVADKAIIQWDATPSTDNPTQRGSGNNLTYNRDTGICTIGNTPLVYPFTMGGLTSIDGGIVQINAGSTYDVDAIYQSSIKSNFDETTGSGNSGSVVIMGTVAGTGFTDAELYSFVMDVFVGTGVANSNIKFLTLSSLFASSLFGSSGEVMINNLGITGDLSVDSYFGSSVTGEIKNTEGVTYGGGLDVSGTFAQVLGAQVLVNSTQVQYGNAAVADTGSTSFEGETFTTYVIAAAFNDGSGTNIAGQTVTVDWQVTQPLLIPAGQESEGMTIGEARILFGTTAGSPANGFGNFPAFGSITEAPLPANSDNSLLHAVGAFGNYTGHGATIISGQYYADTGGVLTQISNEDDAVLAAIQEAIIALESRAVYDTITGTLTEDYALAANHSYVGVTDTKFTGTSEFVLPDLVPDNSIIIMELSQTNLADTLDFKGTGNFPSGNSEENILPPTQGGTFTLIWWKNPAASDNQWVYVITANDDKGLETVAHDATLTGLGTDASLLSVTNPPCQPVFRENPNHTRRFNNGSFFLYPEPLGKFPQFVTEDGDYISSALGVWAEIFTPESLNNYQGYYTPLPDLDSSGYPGVRLEMSVIGNIYHQNQNQGYAGFAIEDSDTISGSNNGLFVGFKLNEAAAADFNNLAVFGMNSNGTIGSLLSESSLDSYPSSGDVVGFFIVQATLYPYAVIGGVYKVMGGTDLLAYGIDTDSLAVSAYASHVETASGWGFELHALSSQWNGVATAKIADHGTDPLPYRDLCGGTSVPILHEANEWTGGNVFSLDVASQGSISSELSINAGTYLNGNKLRITGTNADAEIIGGLIVGDGSNQGRNGKITLRGDNTETVLIAQNDHATGDLARFRGEYNPDRCVIQNDGSVVSEGDIAGNASNKVLVTKEWADAQLTAFKTELKTQIAGAATVAELITAITAACDA